MMKSPFVSLKISKPKTKKPRCHICKKKLLPHEGKICSCDKLLCMKHRYRADHSCTRGMDNKIMPRIVPEKVKMI